VLKVKSWKPEFTLKPGPDDVWSIHEHVVAYYYKNKPYNRLYNKG